MRGLMKELAVFSQSVESRHQHKKAILEVEKRSKSMVDILTVNTIYLK